MTEIEINGTKYRCYEDGKIEKYYDKKFRHFNEGWNNVKCFQDNYLRFIDKNRKHHSVHRLMAVAFLGLNYDDKTIFIDHINHNKLDNRLENLRLVTHQQNQWNRVKAKGYCLTKTNKYESYISINKKRIYLGKYDTEEEAHNAYLEAKEKYHQI